MSLQQHYMRMQDAIACILAGTFRTFVFPQMLVRPLQHPPALHNRASVHYSRFAVGNSKPT
jgi:hypothetical protein